jgi:uncharacterized iron-regulated membrane protein
MLARTLKFLHRAHVYAGVFVALHFVVLTLSGLALLFKDFNPRAATSEERTATPAQYAAAWRDALARYPGDRPLAIFPDEQDPGVLHLRLGPAGAREFRGARKLRYDTRAGSAEGDAPVAAGGFFAWTLRLHRELLLGGFGKLYIGFVGLVLVFVIVSGALIYGNFMRRREFGEIRRLGPARTLDDLHKFLGAGIFGWTLLVSVTGGLLAFNGLLLKIYQRQSLHALLRHVPAAPAPLASAPLERVLTTALRTRAGTELAYVAFPDTEYSLPGHFLVLVNGAEALTRKVSELVVIESATGHLRERVALPLYLKLAMLAEPLHFGNYGGRPLRILWMAFSVLTLGLTLTGVAAYLIRWRRARAAQAYPRPSGTTALRPSSIIPVWLRGRYALPGFFALLTLAGAACALLTEGVWQVVACAGVGLPLLAMAWLAGTLYRDRSRHA